MFIVSTNVFFLVARKVSLLFEANKSISLCLREVQNLIQFFVFCTICDYQFLPIPWSCPTNHPSLQNDNGSEHNHNVGIPHPLKKKTYISYFYHPFSFPTAKHIPAYNWQNKHIFLKKMQDYLVSHLTIIISHSKKLNNKCDKSILIQNDV